ncbi:DNA polymerase I [Anatilimnocola floriformis]|uniref:DNA polymerase I n=1 Tax=Anatilimnocola floriformis TaxID=2948575 RepID=UPI0020C5AA61|nr:DNA polymerase I [Anatilimnocola floriformis]
MAKKSTKSASQPLFAGFDDPAPEATVTPLNTAAEAVVTVDPDEVSPASEAAFTLTGKKVFLVDAYSLIYQVFHVMPEMTGPSGQPVGAAFGFVRDMLDLIEGRGAEVLVVAFDHPGDTFRHELYPEYKAQRTEMPADLQPQIPLIHQYMEALGIPAVSIAGFEADDLLATLARQVDEAGGDCFIVTSDKDCRQLITDRVKMYSIRKNAPLDKEALLADWGIRPDQVVDFQALVGDKVDNVPGIAGIGPKTATDLLVKYETLEGVFAHVAELKGKLKERIETGHEAAFSSRELVRLKNDIPLEFNWAAATIGNMQGSALAELNRAAGFRQLAQRMEKIAAKYPAAKTARKKKVEADDLEDVAEELGIAESAELPMGLDDPNWKATYRTIATVEDLDRAIEQMKQQPLISFDTETTSLRPRQADMVGYSFAWQSGEAYYVPVRAPEGEPQLDEKLVLEKLRPILEDERILKIGQNIKYDLLILRSLGVTLRGAAFDTMVADYLLDPGERSHNLDDLALRHLSHQNITITSLIGSGKGQKRMDEVPVQKISDYASEDADVPLRLKALLEPRLESQQLTPLFRDLEMPLIEVLAEMEFNGVRIDPARLKELDEKFTAQIDQLQKDIYEIAGGEFNIDSRNQLAKLLFEDCKLPIVKRTKTGPSTDVDVLEELARLHPLPAKIIEYRQYAKLQSTYVVALQQLVNPTTGRVHTSFKQDVAATGRLSSQDPNLQNIPVRTEAGRAIRSAFLPGPAGWQLMTADYSQIELRVLAHFSNDETLREAFLNDRDIHTQVAAGVYNLPLEEVTREMRSSAKAINFGIIYGQSPFGLSKALDINQSEAASFIEAYFARLPGVETFMQQVLLDCRRDGFVSTILSRRRPVQGVRDPKTLRNKRQRNLPERIAINTVIQGSAADIIKQAMLNVHRRLKREGLQSKLLLQIHDELVFEFPPDEQERLAKLVGEEMSTAAQLSVPLKVDVKTGPNWAACEVLE